MYLSVHTNALDVMFFEGFDITRMRFTVTSHALLLKMHSIPKGNQVRQRPIRHMG